MDHFLIQDSEVFPVLEAKPEADLPAGHHCSCERPPFLLLFPESPFPPLFYSARMGTIMWNDGCLPLPAQSFCCCCHPKSPCGIPFLLLGSPPYWESHRLPWWNRRVPATASWCPELELAMFLFQKQRWTWWWDFMVLLMDCYTPGTTKNEVRSILGVGSESNHNVSRANWLLICQ